jgi:hypothetical protein
MDVYYKDLKEQKPNCHKQNAKFLNADADDTHIFRCYLES